MPILSLLRSVHLRHPTGNHTSYDTRERRRNQNKVEYRRYDNKMLGCIEKTHSSSFLLLYEHTREDTLSNRMLQYNSLASYCKRVRLEVYLKTISLIIIRHITNTFFLFPSQLEQRDLSASKAHPFSSVPAMKYLRLYISRHHKYCISTMNPSVVRIGVAHETIHVELFTERVSVV